MHSIRSRITIFAVTLAAAVAGACGGDASLSSVGPSSASSSGASISGTITGTALSAPRLAGAETFSVMDTRGVNVSVVGTGISTTADNQGQFTLTNVPAGTVQLNFSGPGSNATVTVSGVGPTDKVQISVTVNGNTAHVDSEHHSAPDNNKREFQGRISAIDSTGSSFQIPGLTVKTTATTIIRHGNRTMTLADLKVGDHIEARGAIDGTTLTATEIKVERDGDDEDDDQGEDEHDNEAEVSGLTSASTGSCPSVTFMVQNTKVAVNSTTVYSHTTCADATKNNVRVEIKGTKQSDGSFVATRVSLDD
jgi:hypothetical protein